MQSSKTDITARPSHFQSAGQTASWGHYLQTAIIAAAFVFVAALVLGAI